MFFKKKNFDFSQLYPLFFTVIFVVILFQYSFATLESIFYDLRVRSDWGISFQDNIVLVTMDEESDEFLGESYPYTYTTHLRFFQKLTKDNPRVINYFSNLLEPENAKDVESLDKLKNHIKRFVAEGGGFRFGTDMDAWGEQRPPEDLRDLGYSLALINQDNAAFSKDDVSRRAILNYAGESSLHLWTANQYREYKYMPALTANDTKGSYYVKKADASFVMFRYYTSPLETNGKVKTIPFHRVLVGNFPKGYFSDKIVLVGSSYMSNVSDYVLTPFNKEEYKAPKLAVHAAIIEALIQNKTVYPLPRMITYILSIILAIVLSVLISKVKPSNGLFLTIAIMLSILIVSNVLFSLFGIWLYITHLILTVFVVYYIWVPFRAIGEYQRRYAIQEETKLIKQVEHLKQNFISLMSHDLKTPVAKIAGIADNMLRQERVEDYKKNVYTIIDSTKELNKFITSILDLTKVESRNLNLNKSSKDINKVIDNVIDELRYEATRKKILVDKKLSPLYPIQFDPILMKRVLSNLVENAIKYSEEGSHVKIHSWDDEEWVYIEIEDNGVGIPAEDLEHIFDKFYRVKNDSTHKVKGTGLGLYLVKYFVELHGGTIVAKSELGQGTKFTVTLINK